MARALAIDYGEKRVGIAVSDTLAIIANPLRVVTPDELLDFLENYMKNETVDVIVLGDPKTLGNRPGPLSKKVKALADSISKRFPAIEVRLLDERFTSTMAAKTLVEAGYPRKQRQHKENLDKVSAAILLQNYLDSRS